jgi:anti-sigma factor RsiW
MLVGRLSRMRRGRAFMTDCTSQNELQSYHDGELAPDRRELLRRHAETCGQCSRELRQLREMSDLLTLEDAGDMTDDELNRLHVGVSQMLDDTTTPTLAFPWVKALCAAAASILIIAAAWMAQPQPPTRLITQRAPLQDWEKLAMGRQMQSLPSGVGEPKFADSEFAQFLLDNLQPREIHENY